MKKFFLWSAVLFFVAGVITVLVFFLVNTYSVDEIAVSSALNEATSTVISVTETTTTEATQAIVEKIPEGGIPLSSLPLTESHKKALAAAQIDVETFVITEAMIICAGEKVGDERMAEIVAGNAPSILEMGKLIPCLL